MKPKTAKTLGSVLAALSMAAVFGAAFAIVWFLLSALSGCASLPAEGVSFTVTASQDGVTITPGGAGGPPAEPVLSGGAGAESPSLDTPSATPPDDESACPPQSIPDSSPDGVAFSSLSWRFGGFSGADAALSTPRIASLSAKASGLSFKWQTGLSDWGLADDDASAIAALFVQTPDGSWVGGKFDWISTSRSTRDFKNIYEGYNGWSLSGLANPCPACFVVVSKDGKLRSNVLGPVSWKR